MPTTWFALEVNEQRDVAVKDLAEHETDASRTWESWNSQWRDIDRQRLVKQRVCPDLTVEIDFQRSRVLPMIRSWQITEEIGR